MPDNKSFMPAAPSRWITGPISVSRRPIESQWHAAIWLLVGLLTLPLWADSATPSLGPYVEYLTPETARVHWHTAEPSTTCLEYGLAGPDARHSPTYALGGKHRGNLDQRIEDNQKKRKHACMIAGLMPQRIYAYRIRFNRDGVDKVTDVFPLDLGLNYAASPLPPAANPYEGKSQGGKTATRAQTVLAQSGDRPGICLVWGLTDGQLAYELANRSRLTVIGLDNNPQTVSQVRQHLHRAGVYGGRLSVRLVEHLDGLPFPGDLANLIVSERAVTSPAVTPAQNQELKRVLRPQGGHLWLPGDSHPQHKKTGQVGSWTHQYGDAGNTANSHENLGGASHTEQLQVQWLGKPGADFGIDRNPRMPAPLAVSGKLFHQGMNRMAALDSYNGTVLWSLEVPELRRVNLPRDAGNWCSDEDSLYVAVRDRCWIVDHNDGCVRQTVSLPAESSDPPYEWGYIGRHGSVLFGSHVRKGMVYRKFWGGSTWYDKTGGFGTGKVCSDGLFGHDLPSDQTLWHRRSVIVNATISIANGRVFFVENRNPAVRNQANRRLNDADFWKDQFLVALDARSGQVLWERALDTAHGVVVYFMACTDDTVVLCSSAEGKYHLYAYAATTGQPQWKNQHPWPSDNHGGHMQHPVVFDDRIFLEPCGYDLGNGRLLTQAVGRHEGCATYCGMEHALLYRGSGRRTAMWDIREEEVSTWYNLRPSCWLSTIAANGMILLPEGGGGCSCGNWLETSLALAPISSTEQTERK